VNGVNDFAFKIGTVNGTGSASANGLLMQAIFRMGIPVSGKNIFPSNIQGLPTWYEIRVSKDGYVARPSEVDLVLALNPATGTLTLRAVFPNPDGLLRPGMNTRVRIVYEVAQNALLIPQRAVTELLGKQFASVVVAGDKVEQRPIRTGARIGDQWLVEEGLKAGERIVVDGLQKAKPGAVVKPLAAAKP